MGSNAHSGYDPDFAFRIAKDYLDNKLAKFDRCISSAKLRVKKFGRNQLPPKQKLGQQTRELQMKIPEKGILQHLKSAFLEFKTSLMHF